MAAYSTQNPVRMTVGSFQAKTYFADLLRKVENGAIVTITRNGHDVAVMQSPQTASSSKSLDAWKRLMAISDSINEQNKTDPIRKEDIMEWKNDGRK